MLEALPSWEGARKADPPRTLDEAWSQVKLAFDPLERALVTQAGATAGDSMGWAAKCRLLWELTDAAAWLTVHLAARDPGQFAAWRAEIDAVFIPPG